MTQIISWMDEKPMPLHGSHAPDRQLCEGGDARTPKPAAGA
ncbi:hypothetical protein [Candidatus Villigracilis affinis]